MIQTPDISRRMPDLPEVTRRFLTSLRPKDLLNRAMGDHAGG
jgi:hypothetical protein